MLDRWAGGGSCSRVANSYCDRLGITPLGLLDLALFCSDYNRFAFVDAFNRLSHRGVADRSGSVARNMA